MPTEMLWHVNIYIKARFANIFLNGIACLSRTENDKVAVYKHAYSQHAYNLQFSY
jgi:hypothetical protein